MSAGLPFLARLLVSLYSLALRLYPAGVRGEYAAEMQAVFSLKAADTAQRGAWSLFTLACREARDLPLAIVSAHLSDAERGRMRSLLTYFPTSTDQTPWPVALLSLLPFFIAGPVRIVVMLQPRIPEQYAQHYLLFLLVSALVVGGGFVLGIVRRFPRWAYPYATHLAFSLSLLVGYAAGYFHWAINVQNSFYVFLAAILALLWLPGCRWFYRHIPQDWTLLSYGLYGFAFYLLSSIEVEGTSLSLLILLPSLLALGTALAHLRIRSAFRRMAVLLAGTYVGLFIWLIPIYLGMIHIVFGIAIGTFLLLLYGTVLTGLLLAPLLVTYAIRSQRASRAAQ